MAQPTQIEVITPDKKILDLNLLSAVEREVIFDELTIGLRSEVPIVYLDNFRLLQDILAARILTTTTIPEIVLRGTIVISLQIAMNTRWMIIMLSVPKFIERTVEVSGSASTIGGVVSLKSKGLKKALMQIYRSTDVKGALRMRFPTYIPAKTNDVPPLNYTVPGGVESSIIGLYLVPPGYLPVSPGTQVPEIIDLSVTGAYNPSLLYYGATSRQPQLLQTDMEAIQSAMMYAESVLGAIESSASISTAVFSAKTSIYQLIPSPPSDLQMNPQLSSLFGQRIPTNTIIAYSQAFPQRGGEIVLSMQLRGYDNAETQGLISTYKMISTIESLQSILRRSAAASRFRDSLFRFIAQKVLSGKRFAEVDRSAKIAFEPFEQHTTSAEHRIVMSALKRREDTLKAIVGNKCPHRAVLARFRAMNFDYKSQDIFRSVMEFAGKSHNDNAVIKCKNCGYDLICPHIKALANAIYDNATSLQIKELMTPFIDVAIASHYYCKICGESISEADAFADTLSSAEASTLNSISEDLRKSMYSEAGFVLRQFTIGPLVQQQRIILSCIAAIYEFVQEVERQLLKSRTNTAEDLKNKRKLFISIYVYAYFAFLALSSRGKKDQPQITIRGLEANAKPADVVKQAIKLIISTKNIVLNKIPNATNEFLKDKFLEAYRNVSAKAGIVPTSKVTPDSLASRILLDPIYWYAYNILLLHDHKIAKNPLEMSSLLLKFDVRKPPFPKNIYAKLYQPHGITSIIDDLYALKADHKYTLPDRKYVARLQSAAKYAGYVLWTSRINKGLMDIPLYTEAAIHPEHLEYMKNASSLLTAVRILRGTTATLYARMPVRTAIDPKNLPFLTYTRQSLPITFYYDTSGLPHCWNLYVYRGDIVVMPSEATEKVPPNALMGGPIMKKCSVCMVTTHNYTSLDAAKVKSAVEHSQDVGALMQAYRYRCPHGDGSGAHIFIEETCSQCGLNLQWAGAYNYECPKGGEHEFAVRKDKYVCRACDQTYAEVYNTNFMLSAHTYYEKYLEAYKREPMAVERIEIEQITDIHYTDFSDRYAQYTYNFNLLLELSQVSSVNVNLLNALGATSQVEYAQIVSGVYVPEEPYSRDATRIFTIHSYTTNAIIKYNQMKFAYSFVKTPQNIADLLTSVPKDLVERLPQVLPDISTGYSEEFEWFRKNKKPREILDWTLEQFAYRLLNVHKDKSIETQALRTAFVKSTVEEIVKSDRLLAKAGDFNFGLIYEGTVEEPEGYNENLDPESGEQKEEDRVQEILDTNEDITDTAEPLQANFDIDTMEDAGETGDIDAVLEDNQAVAVEGYDDLK